MQKRRLILLFRPKFGGIASVCLIALSLLVSSVSAHAQTEGDLSCKSGYNKDVRTGTWSIYAQGGLSWASGVWYENVDAKRSYGMSPAVGGGIDYTILPWVRVGVEYMWSSYRREQRLSSLDASSMPIKAYGNYMMNYHNVKLGADFNIMEFWPERKAQWFNIWLGTGAGYMMAQGNEYGIFFSTLITQNGVSRPATGDISIDNNSSVTIQGNVKTTNDHSAFNRFYIPASLHVEFDVSRQFTVGIKGEMDFVMNRKEVAPKSLVFGLVTLRYNIVPSKARKMQEHYDGCIAALESNVQAALTLAEAEKARADKAEAESKCLKQEIADRQRSLDDCIQSKANMVVAVEKPEFTILFENNSSYFNKEQEASLKAFAQQHMGRKLSIIAEASNTGTKDYNQRLSERRLGRVVKALQEIGFTVEDLKPSFAIGAQRGIDSAEARRVTITVE